jgi:hypothetical protein
VTRLRAGPFGVLIPRKEKNFFFFLQNFQTNCRALSQKASNKGVTMTTHLHLTPRLIMRRAYTPTPLIHIPSMQWDCSYLHHHTTKSCSGATIVLKGTQIYISVYSKYLKSMPIFSTYSSVCHQFNEGDSRWCLYNPTLQFLFQSRKFFLAILIGSVNIIYIYLHFTLNIPQ